MAIPAHYARDCRVSCARVRRYARRARGRVLCACISRASLSAVFAYFFRFRRFPPIRGKDCKKRRFCPPPDNGRGCPFSPIVGGCLVWVLVGCVGGVGIRSRSLAHGLRIAEKPRTAHGLRVSACLPLVSVSAVVSVRQILSF